MPRTKSPGTAVSKVRHTVSQPGDKRYLVPVVLNTFRVMRELSTSGGLGLNDVAQRTGISKSTVFRILTTLHHLGYVLRDERRNYYVSRSLGELVSENASADALRKAALPQMLRLRNDFGETVNLGHLVLDKVIYVEVVPSEYALKLSERPGASVPAHASSLGKAILAFSPAETLESLLDDRPLPLITRNTITDPEAYRRELRRVRERGIAFDRRETSLLANCVAAPILDASGVAVAAMSVSGPASRFNPRIDSPAVSALLAAATVISRQFGAPGDPPRRARKTSAPQLL